MTRKASKRELIKGGVAFIALFLLLGVVGEGPRTPKRTVLHPTPRDEIERSAERANANAYQNLSGHNRKTSMLALEVRK